MFSTDISSGHGVSVEDVNGDEVDDDDEGKCSV